MEIAVQIKIPQDDQPSLSSSMDISDLLACQISQLRFELSSLSKSSDSSKTPSFEEIQRMLMKTKQMKYQVKLALHGFLCKTNLISEKIQSKRLGIIEHTDPTSPTKIIISMPYFKSIILQHQSLMKLFEQLETLHNEIEILHNQIKKTEYTAEKMKLLNLPEISQIESKSLDNKCCIII